MSLEKTLRANVLQILKKAGRDPKPVENPIGPGFPDVEFIGGTIELKQVSNWPSRSSTPLRLPHYAQVQRVWHTRRWSKGGNITVLLQVNSEYLLFRGNTAAIVLGYDPQFALREAAYANFPNLRALRSGLDLAIQEAR